MADAMTSSIVESYGVINYPAFVPRYSPDFDCADKSVEEKVKRMYDEDPLMTLSSVVSNRIIHYPAGHGDMVARTSRRK